MVIVCDVDGVLNNLMDVMELAGQLDNRAPYDGIVNNTYAENAINNLK